eukprot:CAMPEP_0184377658 /NCGR_PEP_ID=MMETSP0007-20130409/2453_1 /TAXON_ID=97485 /ORGANISM="Prymnesium parvum, Strain Texoma1" /LENGTH=69 /DNA_ID=CAMNT_0026721649 /DNA_START=289 /DNA_END=498 /DNA_ORIENTATION=+
MLKHSFQAQAKLKHVPSCKLKLRSSTSSYATYAQGHVRAQDISSTLLREQRTYAQAHVRAQPMLNHTCV